MKSIAHFIPNSSFFCVTVTYPRYALNLKLDQAVKMLQIRITRLPQPLPPLRSNSSTKEVIQTALTRSENGRSHR